MVQNTSLVVIFIDQLASLKDEDWDAMRDTIKSTNEKDKAKRSV
jgi:hypothetical protein